MSRPSTGLIIGKFLPPHQGHLHLIDTARAQVDHLTVLVCTLAREPIPGHLRHAWLTEIYKDALNVTIVHNPDENPQEPHEHPDFWNIWKTSIERHHAQPIDKLFSSEHYGFELAKHLNCRHVPVDIERSTVTISGTAVRRHPGALWDFIPEVVRPYFLRRVVITGSESTGKSTLARRLAEHFNTHQVHEYAREYLEGLGVHVDDLKPEHIPDIARGHTALEDHLAATANRVLFLDTDLIVTKIYAEHYFGECPEFIKAEARARRYDLHLLLSPDVPWVEDSLRNLADERDVIHAKVTAELENHDCNVRVISGDWEERFATAVRHVDDLLMQPMAGVEL